MSFEIWRPWVRLAFLEPKTQEYIFLTVYALVALALLFRHREGFKRLNWHSLPLFVGLLVSPLLANHLFVLSFPLTNLLPPPGVPFGPSRPSAPLLGALPVVVTGAWLGAGPALLVGLIGGILRIGMINGGILDPFYFACLGFGVPRRWAGAR